MPFYGAYGTTNTTWVPYYTTTSNTTSNSNYDTVTTRPQPIYNEYWNIGTHIPARLPYEFSLDDVDKLLNDSQP